MINAIPRPTWTRLALPRRGFTTDARNHAEAFDQVVRDAVRRGVEASTEARE